MTKPTPDNDNAPKKRYIITYDYENQMAIKDTKEEAEKEICLILGRNYSKDDINIYEVGEPMHPVIGF